jgi:hypothetical protein
MCGKRSGCKERIPLCMADTLSHSISSEIQRDNIKKCVKVFEGGESFYIFLAEETKKIRRRHPWERIPIRRQGNQE